MSNNFRYKIAQVIENQIHMNFREYESVHLGLSKSPKKWVQISQNISPPHQFPLNSDMDSEFPILPLSFDYILNQLKKTYRYNGNSGEKTISVYEHTAKGLEVIKYVKSIQSREDSSIFLDILALMFMFHDFEEAIIGDIISPVEKALGLNLDTYKSFIRGIIINRVLLGLPHTYTNKQYLILAYLAFLPYGGIVDIPTVIKNQRVFYDLSILTDNTCDPNYRHDLIDSSNGLDEACFTYEAQSFATLPWETWYCNNSNRFLAGVTHHEAFEVVKHAKVFEINVDEIFSNIFDWNWDELNET